MAFFLGGILGGPEHPPMRFYRQLKAIAVRQEALQNAAIQPVDGLVNVVFLFSGSLFRPDFAEMRVGRFIKRENRLEIKVPVQPDAITAEDFPQRYIALLKLALVEAKRVFDKKGILFSLEDHFALADRSLEGLLETT